MFPHGDNVPQDISRFPRETNVLVPSSNHLRHVSMKSTFHPTSPHRTLQGEYLMMLPQTSTLPLSEGDILCHTKLVSEVHKIFSGQLLGQNVCSLLISRNVLKYNSSSLHLNIFAYWVKPHIHTWNPSRLALT
jgi:hypothetical protein